MAAVFVGADFMGAALAGAAPAASSCLGPSPCDGREWLGGGAHGSRRCPNVPLPNPPLPSQGRESKLAASAAPSNAARGKAPAGPLPPRHLPTCPVSDERRVGPECVLIALFRWSLHH